MADNSYIIVGQGLAGSILALTLMERNCKVLVVDDGYLHSSSKVAAGMWNPVNFRKNRPVWNAAQLVPAMDDFYNSWQEKLGLRFVHPRLIVRPFQTIDQQNDWLACSGDPKYAPYFSDESTSDLQGIRLNFPDGYGIVKNAGFIDVPVFLEGCRNYLKEKNAYAAGEFDYNEVKLYTGEARYREHTATGIIFCEGHKAAHNPWFSYLPFRNAKGEIITLRSTGLPRENIASKGIWIVPVGEHRYKAGATFAWDDLTSEPTPQALQKLRDDLSQLTDSAYEVEQQQAGIRPATSDRRPFAGTHPEMERIHIMNGLGTKGVMIAPWLARQFSDHLLNQQPLDPEVNITRHLKFYTNHA
jgi:glycine/D-amino acid oxidase-like deaminating enzyme